MKIAYFDCFSGISGDMTVGALLSAGMPLEVLRSELATLELTGYHVSVRTLERSMIAATKFDVTIEAEHTHAHDQLSHAEVHLHSHGLSYREIVALIERSRLTDRVKQRSLAIFRVIAEAEAVIHGVDLERVHFHEVGAIDSIVDIVATAVGLEHFGIEECRSRTVPLGAGGIIRTAHGNMPIPTPATLSILAGYPTELGMTHAELTTPTGAGIIKALSSGLLEPNEVLSVEAIGYGAGTQEFAEQPNLLRLVIAELEGSPASQVTEFAETDTVTQLTASIDDMTPVELSYAQEALLEAGALEVYLRPIVMKKGRAAHELIVLCAPASTDSIMEVVARETTTIGVRVETVGRRKAQRTVTIAEHPEFGTFRYKQIGTASLRKEPEYEDVKRISRERGLTLRDVMAQLRSVLS